MSDIIQNMIEQAFGTCNPPNNSMNPASDPLFAQHTDNHYIAQTPHTHCSRYDITCGKVQEAKVGINDSLLPQHEQRHLAGGCLSIG